MANGTGDIGERAAGGELHPAVMFYAAIAYLGILAVVVQWWNASKILDHDSEFTIRLMAVIWIPFVFEALAGVLLGTAGGGRLRRLLLVSALPPFRIGYSTFHPPGRIWLPRLGWRDKGRELAEEIDRLSLIPMLVIALMILPLLGIEFLLRDRIGEMPVMSMLLDVSAAFIWFAFALEFIVLLSVVDV